MHLYLIYWLNRQSVYFFRYDLKKIKSVLLSKDKCFMVKLKQFSQMSWAALLPTCNVYNCRSRSGYKARKGSYCS